MEHAPLIRPLGPADRDALFQLRLRAVLAHPEAFAQSHQEALAKGPQHYDAPLRGAGAANEHVVLGAFMAENQPLVGMVGFKRQERSKERHKAQLLGMYVAPEAAGRGIGRALVEQLLARARGIDGLQLIQLAVTAGNDAARHLYESAGFRCYGRESGGLCVDGVLHDTDLMAFFI
jgi:ribosomal protein S18 acetylase RimI-like enzyme